MCLLSIGAIIMGYIFKDIYIGLGSYISGIFIHPNNIYILDTEFSINHIYKLLPLYGIIIGTISVLYIYELQYYKVYIYNNEYMYKIYTLFNSRFLYDQLLNNKILRPLLSLSSNINNNIEKGLIYNIGPYGI
jgi:NADH-ubiquinone oxidoreductase chain 5